MSLLDWLNDTGVFGSGAGGDPKQAMISATNNYQSPGSPPADTMMSTGPMPPPQMAGQDQPSLNPETGMGAGPPPGGSNIPPDNLETMMGQGPPNGMPTGPYPAGGDPMTAGGTPGNGPGLPARPPAPPGPPMQIAPPGDGTNGVGPGLGVGAPPSNNAPGQTWLGRAFGITPDQAGLRGREVTSGLAAGLKNIGAGGGMGKGKFAAFAGGAGAAMEGAQQEKGRQDKQMTDYLNSAIKAKQAGDEARYKRNYLRYLAAKLQADTDKAANPGANNKNDSPTQLYLSAQRLVQPERNAMNKVLEQMRKDGATPDELARKQSELQAGIDSRLTDHYANLGIHPQQAAEIAKMPGNTRENPVDAGQMGITKDNIGQKLQPGQYFKNPADGKIYEYKGPSKGEGSKKGAIPDKPTEPEPPNPMKPYKTPLDGGDGGDGGED